MKKLLLSFIIVASFFSQAQTPYIERLIPASGSRAGFVAYFPHQWEQGKKYPLLFVLHGIDEQGKGDLAGLRILAKHDNYSPAETFGKQYGFLIIEPQTSSNWQYGEVEEAYQWLKDSLFDKINWKKVALTGTSLGGGGVYRYLSINPGAHLLFSAAVPNGAGPYKFFVSEKNITNVINTKVPVWAFHNRGDQVAPADQSTLFFFNKWKELKGTANMWVSIFDFNGHTFPAYNRGKGNTLLDGLKFSAVLGNVFNPACNLYEWILMQEIGKPGVAPPIIRITVPGIPQIPVQPKPQPIERKLLGMNFFAPNVKVQLVYSDGTSEVIEAPKGDSCNNIWVPGILPLRATMKNKRSAARVIGLQQQN